MSELISSLLLMGAIVLFCLSVLGAGLLLVRLFFHVLERIAERGYSRR